MAPMSTSRTLRAVMAAITVSLVAACGGGGNSAAPSPPLASGTAISRVVVAGDSLADVGTFGFKATVQSAANPAAGYPLYPEIVARDLGTGSLCSYFSSGDGKTFPSTRPGCTDFAVGGASIVNPVTQGGDALPFSVKDQLQTAQAANGGAWRAGDLVVVDAGANDAAGLAVGYLGAQRGGVADQAVYLALLGQQLSGSTIDQALSQANGRSVAARLYMQQLARTFWDMVKANTLDKGATRVALVNVPDITLTPRFRSITAGVATDQGAAAAAEFVAAVRGWIVAFNTELATLAAGDPRVVIAPYFDDSTAENATPAAYGLTNTTDASCPPNVDFPACTDAALDASPPAGLGAGWWKTWLYSNAFHPSP
ncbi:MAG: SGNH/GDSL hydrolase family protein, partial [Ramlibacter sp.]